MAAMTEKGFVRPTYAQLLAEAENRAKTYFGSDIDTGEHTALGKFLRIVVYDLASLYEEMEGVYFARFPGYAAGVNLDRLTPFAGITRNPAVAAAYPLRLTGQADAVIEAGFLLATKDGVSFRTEAPVTLDKNGVAETTVTCTKRGPVGNVPAGAIGIVVNPDARVENAEQSGAQLVEGRERESDAELRARFQVAIAGIGSATLDAVKAAVMRVPGVQGAVLLENDTDVAGPGGLPPHSFEAFVLKDAASDYEVAEAIFSKKPLGIAAHGQVPVEVLDSAGNGHTVRFSRVEEIFVKLRLRVRVDNLYPGDGAARIAEALSGAVNAYPNGRDLMYTALYPLVYSVPGVVEVCELAVSADGGGRYAAENVPASPAQAVRIDRGDVEVTSEPYVDRG